MKKLKILLGICLVALLNNSAKAQLNAQSDLFSVLKNSCSNYLDVTANDNVDSLQQLQIYSQPQNGIAGINGKYLSYCVDSGYIGADQFQYVVTTSSGTDTTTVYLNVEDYNNFIFAGDADQNGTVENFDVLALGLAYNLNGPARLSPTSINALAWNPSSFINSNPGAADCNGDGIVDYTDLISIENNYNQTFPYPNKFDVDTSQCNGNGISFFIESLSGDTVQDGDTLNITIKLGDDIATNEAYGIAFTLEFDTRFIAGNNIELDKSTSWLLQNDAGLLFKRSFQQRGEMEIALTRTNHVTSSGGGAVLIARMPIDDNIDGVIEAPGTHLLDIRLKKVRLISEYNIVRNICLQQPTIQVNKILSGITWNEMGAVKVYPNPTNQLLFIEAENIRELEMTDITGRIIYTLHTEGLNKLSIDLKEFSIATGNYFLKIKTEEFVSTKKISVIH